MDPSLTPRNAGPWLMAAGAVLFLLGLLTWSGVLRFFGRLPGDFQFGGEHARVYFPLTSMLLVSAGFSLLLALARRFWS